MKPLSKEIRYLLDSSALLALIGGEPGHQTVGQLLNSSAVSSVIVSETADKLLQAGFSAREAGRWLDGLQLQEIPWESEISRNTTAHAAKGLSLADRICLATAEAYGVTAVTADHLWSKQTRVKVLMIR